MHPPVIPLSFLIHILLLFFSLLIFFLPSVCFGSDISFVNYVFVGDFVDRGSFSLVRIFLPVLDLKIFLMCLISINMIKRLEYCLENFTPPSFFFENRRESIEWSECVDSLSLFLFFFFFGTPLAPWFRKLSFSYLLWKYDIRNESFWYV